MNTKTNDPNGWMLAGTHPADYEMGVDPNCVHQGKSSGYLRSIGETAEGFATMMQVFKADTFRGQKLQLSGFLKTKDVGGWCGLWMRIDGQDEEVLTFDNMNNRPVTGTTEWQPYNIVLQVPESSATISLGVLLYKTGQVWANSLRIDTVGDEVPTTCKDDEILPDQPSNLNFQNN
jgi:hypothetical protein